MKRLSILVLVLLVLVAALAACAPAPEVEPPHEHQFTDEWCVDATYHWHVDTCDHEEEAIASKYEHRDADEDGMCDVCDYYIYYIVTVDAPDIVTVEGKLTGKNEDVVFTAKAPTYYTLYVEGAEQVGEAAVANGVATYTYKVANLSTPDVVVTIDAEQTGYINMFDSVEVEYTTIIKDETSYVDFVVSVPAAGEYTIIPSGTTWYVMLALAEEKDDSDAYSRELILVADEAGDYNLTARVNVWDDIESLTFEVKVYDVYETEVELPALSGSGYIIPAHKNMDPIYLSVVIPTPGEYVFTAEGLLVGPEYDTSYIFVTYEENEIVEIPVAIDDYFEGSEVELAWNVAPLAWNELQLGENTITVPADSTFPLSFTPAVAGDYMIICSNESASFASWSAWGGYFGSPYINQNEAFYVYAEEVFKFGYINYYEDPVELTITVAEYVAPVIESDLVMGNTEIGNSNAFYEYIATENGTLTLTAGEAIGGMVGISYTVNDGESEIIELGTTVEIALEAGDKVVITVESEGWSSLTAAWATEGAGSEEPPAGVPDGSEANPFVFDGSTDILISASNMTPIFVVVKGGVTAYLDCAAQFFDNPASFDGIGTSVSPLVDTTYAIYADTMAGAMGMITATNPNAGSGEGDGEDTPTVETTLKIGNTQINQKDDEYVFYAETEGALILTQGGNVMPSNIVVVTYTINDGEAVTLVPQEGTTIELAQGDIVTIVVTANGGYSSLTAEWFN